MSEPHSVLIYNYVCPTCGLTIGPYTWDHKLIECDTCENLLNPILQKAYMTTADEEEEPQPRVIRMGRVWPKGDNDD